MGLTIKVKVGKQGGSLKMTIPAEITRKLGINKGDYVETGIEGNLMIVSKAEEKNRA